MNIAKENPVESIATIVGLIVVAIGLFVGNQASVFAVTGNILSILGSFLTAVSTTWVFGKTAANKKLVSEVNIVRGQLAMALAQLNHAINTGLSDDGDPYSSLGKIEQTSSIIMMVVHDLSRLTDNKFDNEKEAILQAKNALSDLGARLYDIENNDSDATLLESEIAKELSSQLNGIMNKLDVAYPVPASYARKNTSSSNNVIVISPVEAYLSKLKSMGMRYVIGQQDRALEILFLSLEPNFNFTKLSDLVDSTRLVSTDYLFPSKSHIRGVINILKIGRAFDEKITDQQIKLYRLKDEYRNFEQFKKIHNQVLIHIASLCNIPINIVTEKILGIDVKEVDNLMNDFSIDDELTKNAIHLESLSVEVSDIYSGNPIMLNVIDDLIGLSKTKLSPYQKVISTLEIIEESDAFKSELMTAGIPLSTIREAISISIPNFNLKRLGFNKFIELMHNVENKTSMYIRNIDNVGPYFYLAKESHENSMSSIS